MTQVFFSIAIIQGFLLIGIVSSVFINYFRQKGNKLSGKNIHIVTISASHIALTIATIKTLINHFYNFPNMWYWYVFFAYFLTDTSLIFLLIYIVKEGRLKNIDNKETHAKRPLQ